MTAIRDKLVKSLTNFLANYRELENSAYEGINENDESEEAAVAANDAYDKVVGELQRSLNTVIEHEPYSTEEIAGAMSCLIEALEEIDPDVFEHDGDEDELEDDADDDDEDEEFEVGDDEDEGDAEEER